MNNFFCLLTTAYLAARGRQKDIRHRCASRGHLQHVLQVLHAVLFSFSTAHGSHLMPIHLRPSYGISEP